MATEGIMNVRNLSREDPSAHSVFIDLFDGEAVACSCPDWEHRAHEDDYKHIRFVNANDALLMTARTPWEYPRVAHLSTCPRCGKPILRVEVRGPSRAERYARPVVIACRRDSTLTSTTANKAIRGSVFSE